MLNAIYLWTRKDRFDVGADTKAPTRARLLHRVRNTICSEVEAVIGYLEAHVLETSVSDTNLNGTGENRLLASLRKQLEESSNCSGIMNNDAYAVLLCSFDNLDSITFRQYKSCCTRQNSRLLLSSPSTGTPHLNVKRLAVHIPRA